MRIHALVSLSGTLQCLFEPRLVCNNYQVDTIKEIALSAFVPPIVAMIIVAVVAVGVPLMLYVDRKSRRAKLVIAWFAYVVFMLVNLYDLLF